MKILFLSDKKQVKKNFFDFFQRQDELQNDNAGISILAVCDNIF